jgi:hypothetical protein
MWADYIRDGGRDMYDIGNEVRLRVSGKWTGPLDYTQNCDGSSPRSVLALSGGWGQQHGDTTYTTCKLPAQRWVDRSFGHVFVLVAHSKGSTIDGLSIMGNLGADEGGEQQANYAADPLRGDYGVVGYYKKTYGADSPGRSLADPSVNHVSPQGRHPESFAPPLSNQRSILCGDS